MWRSGDSPESHFIMNGGVLKVPWEQNGTFFDQYIHDIRRNKKLCYVEKRTEKFKFFIDLDYEEESVVEDSYIIHICMCVCEIVGETCYSAIAPPRQTSKGIKCGFHLHWPNHIVTSTEANKIRNTLCVKYPGISKYVDASVYNGSGLRMLWSYKYQNQCHYPPYIPWKVIGTQGVISTFSTNTEPSVSLLELYSIRTNHTQPQIQPSHKTGFFPKLEEHINKYMVGYEDARVLKVGRTRDDCGFYVQTNSKYCENIKKNHTSNHVWLLITNNRIQSMCHDNDCKGSSGKEYFISPSIVNELEIMIPSSSNDSDTQW